MITRYQRTHRPVRVNEVLCTGRELDDRGFCLLCGRWTEKAHDRGRFTRDHAPNTIGSLGYVLTYADGSTRTTKPGEVFR